MQPSSVWSLPQSLTPAQIFAPRKHWLSTHWADNDGKQLGGRPWMHFCSRCVTLPFSTATKRNCRAPLACFQDGRVMSLISLSLAFVCGSFKPIHSDQATLHTSCPPTPPTPTTQEAICPSNRHEEDSFWVPRRIEGLLNIYLLSLRENRGVKTINK